MSPHGTIHCGETMFRAGPMTQYAFYVRSIGAVHSVGVGADTTAGTRVPVQRFRPTHLVLGCGRCGAASVTAR